MSIDGSIRRRGDLSIGCRVLSHPFFLEGRDWLTAPADWRPNIVSFKAYGTDESAGKVARIASTLLYLTPRTLSSIVEASPTSMGIR